MIFDTVYTGKDNLLSWELYKDDKVYTPTITRVTLKVGGKIIDSDLSPVAFDWSSTPGSIHLNLGFEGLNQGIHSGCILTIYNAQNPNGIVWADDIGIEVR